MKPQGGTVSLFLDVALKLIQKRKGMGSRSRTRVDHQEDQEVTIAIEDEGDDGVGEVPKPRGGGGLPGKAAEFKRGKGFASSRLGKVPV